MSEDSLKSLLKIPERRNAYPIEARSNSEPKFEEEVEYQAFAYGRVGRKAEIMLEFRKANGYRLCIPYIDLKEIETSNPTKGFVISTLKRKITIEGSNLERCYRFLQQNRIAELMEIDRPAAMTADKADAIISSLKIENPRTSQGNIKIE